MKQTWLLFILAILLSGCATTPVPISAAKQAPPDRVLAFQTSAGDKIATLTVIRDEGLRSSGCYLGLYINKTLVARLDVAEFARFYVDPGEILLRIAGDPQGKGLCAWSQSDWTQRETFMKPGDQKTFRMTIDVNGKGDIIRSDL